MSVIEVERKNPIDFGSQSQGQGQIWHSVYKTLWTRYNYSFSPITSKLHMSVVDDERRNPIDFELQGQRSRST